MNKNCVINPKTNRAVNKDGKIGMKIVGAGDTLVAVTKRALTKRERPASAPKSASRPASAPKVPRPPSAPRVTKVNRMRMAVATVAPSKSSTPQPVSSYKSPEVKSLPKPSTKEFRNALASSSDRQGDAVKVLQGAVKRLVAPRKVISIVLRRPKPPPIRPAIQLIGSGALARAKAIPNIKKKIDAIKMSIKPRINENTDKVEKLQSKFESDFSINKFIKLQSTFNLVTAEGQRNYVTKMESFIKDAETARTELQTAYGKLTPLERETARNENLRIIIDGEYTDKIKEYFRTYNDNIVK